MRQFILPDLGEGLEEAEIVTWHVNEGDHVVVDQPLVSVETDKAIVEGQRPELLPLDLTEELHLPFDRFAVAYRRVLTELGYRL